MKKLIALLLAAVSAASMTAVAFAENLQTRSGSAVLSVGGADGMTLDGSALLIPGEEYRFPLLIAEDGGEARPMNVEDMQNYDVKVSAQSGGSHMADAGRLESGRQQYLSLTGNAVYAVSAQTVKYALTLTKKDDDKALSKVSVSWKVGYPAMDDEKLGQTTVIEPGAPVITKEQMAAIEKIAGNEKASFVGENWQFDIRLADQNAVNFLHSAKNIAAISDRWPQGDFRFWDFGGKPAFDYTGTLSLDVSDVLDEYENLYLYRYLDGVLYSLNYKLDEDAQTISIQTKQLGSYVVSDVKIANGTAVGGSSAGSGSTGGSDNAGDKENPITGKAAVHVAAALAGMTVGLR